MNRTKRNRLIGAVAAGGLATVAGLVGWLMLTDDGTPRSVEAARSATEQITGPVTRAEADALLRQTVELARNGDVDRICQEVSKSEGMCRSMLEAPGTRDRSPGTLDPEIVGTTRDGHLLILHLEVHDPDGGTFNADFAAQRDGRGAAVSPFPIYWSGASIGAAR